MFLKQIVMDTEMLITNDKWRAPKNQFLIQQNSSLANSK